MILVTEFKGFLYRREVVYKFAKSRSDQTFESSLCTVESDRDIVNTRNLNSSFSSISEFNVLDDSRLRRINDGRITRRPILEDPGSRCLSPLSTK